MNCPNHYQVITIISEQKEGKEINRYIICDTCKEVLPIKSIKVERRDLEEEPNIAQP